jgi:3-isopropylmalate/(R)-2-methylmalate dehydratase large subunit
VLATQTMALGKLKVRRIEVNGKLRPGVYAKDVILHIIRTLGVNGGTGFAYEYAGERLRPLVDGRAHDRLQHVHRGRRARRLRQSGRDDLRLPEGPPYSPKGAAWDEAVARWKSFASDPAAHYDDVVKIDAADIAPTVTWGINPGQGISINEASLIPRRRRAVDEKASIEEALAYMKLKPGAPIKGTKIDVAFLGSCTNGRLSDFQEVAKYIKGRKVAPASRPSPCPARRSSPAVQKARHRQGLPRRRLRVARSRLLDVPGDESRQAHRRPALRQFVQPQLQGPSGQPDRPHDPHEPAHGRRRRRHRHPSPTPAKSSRVN